MKKIIQFYWLGLGLLLCFCPRAFAQTQNLALHQWVSSNSEMQSASLVTDGDEGTRWESEHGVDQVWLTVDLGLRYQLQQVVIKWEFANASDFQVQGSDDNLQWQNLASVEGAAAGERTDSFDIDAAYRYVRIMASERSTSWGYSIWELQVMGTHIVVPPTPTPTPDQEPVLLSLGKNASASSAIQQASYAFDGNMGTRWESLHQVDPASLTIDLGDVFSVSQIVIYWEAANAADYEIQGSVDANSWVSLSQYSGGQFGNREDRIDVAGVYRYVRMQGNSRSANNNWGYSIWEMEVWGNIDGRVPEFYIY